MYSKDEIRHMHNKDGKTMPHCVSAFKEWPKAAPEAEETEGGGEEQEGGGGKSGQDLRDGKNYSNARLMEIEWHWLRGR